MTIVGIDLGGSGSRIITADGNTVAAQGPAFAVQNGRANHADAVRGLAETVRLGADDCSAVAVSAAGLVALGEPESIRDVVAEFWPCARVVVASDAVAAVAGAWGPGGGAIVAAGTGVVAFATDFDVVWNRSDGWGHLLGDDGGAAWIGARGFAAALRALDGRPRGSAALLDSVRSRGLDPLGLPDVVRSAPNPATVLASFAPSVSEAARDDDIARSIIDTAARELADTGLSVLGHGVPARLALVGGLASEPAIAEGFAARVRKLRPDLEVSVGDSTPLDGALALARLAVDGVVPSHPPYLTQFPPTSHTNN